MVFVIKNFHFLVVFTFLKFFQSTLVLRLVKTFPIMLTVLGNSSVQFHGTYFSGKRYCDLSPGPYGFECFRDHKFSCGAFKTTPTAILFFAGHAFPLNNTTKFSVEVSSSSSTQETY